MKYINGTDKQKRLVEAVLIEKEVPALIRDIEALEIGDTKYKSIEKFEHDRDIILNTPMNISAVLQNKTSTISEIIDINLVASGIDDVSCKRIFTALRSLYKASCNIDDNERAEKI